MAIKIKTARTLDRGNKAYKITKIEALTFEELPSKYTLLEGAVYLTSKKTLVRQKNGCFRALLKRGSIFRASEFTEALEKIREAGKMLAEINKQLALENAGWEGEETFVI